MRVHSPGRQPRPAGPATTSRRSPMACTSAAVPTAAGGSHGSSSTGDRELRSPSPPAGGQEPGALPTSASTFPSISRCQQRTDPSFPVRGGSSIASNASRAISPLGAGAPGDHPAWAPSIASGIAEKEAGEFHYDASRFDSEDRIFLDLTRKPADGSCLACHTTREVGPAAEPRWLHDRDVHLLAGMSCVDCHRNGIGHHTVRGYEGEEHPSGNDVSSLSCRGCHLGDVGGRFGSPLPRHAGLPPIHLEKIACTTCHAGPLAAIDAAFQQTSRAHRLGSASQERDDGNPPVIRAPVLLPGDDGLLTPHRVMWPAFWAKVELQHPRPIPLADLTRPLRGSLRVRRDLAAEFNREQFLRKLPAALESIFPADQFEAPGMVLLGKIIASSGGGGTSEWISRESAPYHWPLAHPVRPARQALGSGGCNDCHASDAPFSHGRMEPHGPIPAWRTRILSTSSLADLYGTAPVVRADIFGKVGEGGVSIGNTLGTLERWQPLMEGRDLFKNYALLCTLVGTFLTLWGLLLRCAPRRREEER
ncbi:MAG TPA: hypothetical protein EYN79_06865 [Planctomycetes bacterium]|nr:hypothetical protein [Planctomycetota bacterium]